MWQAGGGMALHYKGAGLAYVRTEDLYRIGASLNLPVSPRYIEQPLSPSNLG